MRAGWGAVAAVALALLWTMPATVRAQGQGQGQAIARLSQDPACTTPKPASAGGPMPKDANTLVLRWLGVSNYELAFRGQIVLFDAFYSRVWPARPLGLLPSQVARANAVFFGHGHWDHAADGPEIAKQTGARMYGGPPTTDFLKAQGVPDAQLVVLKGGETQKFNGFTVQAIHANHAAGRPDAVNKLMDLYEQLVPQFYGRDQTEAEKAELTRLRRRGAGGPRVNAEGTLVYLVTFDNGYRIAYSDTGGPITPELKAAFAGIPRTDIAMVPYTGRFNTTRQNEESIPFVETFKPRIVLPSHHEDETGVGAHFDMPVYPLGIAARDKFPDAQTIDPLYLSGLCFDVQSKAFFVGK